MDFEELLRRRGDFRERTDKNNNKQSRDPYRNWGFSGDPYTHQWSGGYESTIEDDEENEDDTVSISAEKADKISKAIYAHFNLWGLPAYTIIVDKLVEKLVKILEGTK